MKNVILFLVAALCFSTTIKAQQVNQMTILPSNPTSNDTIRIISDFSYFGECSYGMVYSYHDLIDTLLLIMPTYCGYWLTTPCNSIDTFIIGTLPAGNYTLRIEYHQGSVCPISGFDATIAQFDTLITVTETTGMNDVVFPNPIMNLYPNPVKEEVIVDIQDVEALYGYQLKIVNTTGQTVYAGTIHHKKFTADLSTWGRGLYIVTVIDLKGQTVDKRKLVIQ